MRIARFFIGGLLLLAVLLSAAPLAAAPAPAADVGFADFSFFYKPAGASKNIVLAPTGEKPQSKLWYNDGRWWADMFSPAARAHRIFVLNRATQKWADTGVSLDPRPQTKSDCLWDGTHLYVASGGGLESTGAALDGKLFRYSYAGGKYKLDAGFPVTIRPGGAEAIVLAKDGAGKLWVTYAQQNKIFVNRSTTSDAKWGTPFVVPASGANTTVSADDISTVVSYGGKIGVLWSNQTDGSFYFASHTDGAAANKWTGGVVARGTNLADDHMSIKALQADSTGSVYAVVKTSLNTPGQPQIEMFIGRPQSSGKLSWRAVVVNTNGHETRPILLLDASNRRALIFMADESGGQIYYKATSLDAPTFDTQSKGQVVISFARAPFMNNPTSTKQSITSASDAVVLASYDNSSHPSSTTSDIYAHTVIDVPAPALGSRRTYIPLAHA